MAPISVAVAGGTGLIGSVIVRTFLTPSIFPSQVNRVAIFTRKPNSDTAEELRAEGAELVEGLVSAKKLKGFDVLINALSMEGLSLQELNLYADTAVQAGVKVYIPSEFGFDHRAVDLPLPNFKTKQAHEAYAHAIGGDKLKVIAIYTSLFMDTIFGFGVLVGIDWPNRTLTAVGSATSRWTGVHRIDIGKATARLAILAVESPALVPDNVRISGDAISFEELAKLLEKYSGKTFTVETVGMTGFNLDTTPAYLRVILGQGADYSSDNANELVNPGQSLWKWQTFGKFVQESHGLAWV